MATTNNRSSNLQIPVIDISQTNMSTADSLVKALAQHGFAFINGQGLGFTPEILDNVFGLVGLLLLIGSILLILISSTVTKFLSLPNGRKRKERHPGQRTHSLMKFLPSSILISL